MTTDLLAFEVEIDAMRCVVFAATRAKAQWLAVKGYRAAGYGTDGSWPRAKASRAPRYDRSPLRERGPKCWAPGHVEDTLPR